MFKLGQLETSLQIASTSSSVHSPNNKLNKEDLVSSSDEESTSSAGSSFNFSTSDDTSAPNSPGVPIYKDFMPDIREDIVALTKVLEKINLEEMGAEKKEKKNRKEREKSEKNHKQKKEIHSLKNQRKGFLGDKKHHYTPNCYNCPNKFAPSNFFFKEPNRKRNNQNGIDGNYGLHYSWICIAYGN